MKAKNEDDIGEVGGILQFPHTAVKSFLHQFTSDVLKDVDSNEQDGKNALTNGRKTTLSPVSALSRLIENPQVQARPPKPPKSPKMTDINNKSAVRNRVNKYDQQPAQDAPSKDDESISELVDSLQRTDEWVNDLPLEEHVATEPNSTDQTVQGIRADLKLKPKNSIGDTSSVKSKDSGKRGMSPARKPSFKVAAHRTGSGATKPRPAVKVTITPNRVAALTTKFNSLDETSSTQSKDTDGRSLPRSVPSNIKLIVGNKAGVIQGKSVPPSVFVALTTQIQNFRNNTSGKHDDKPKVAVIRKRPSLLTSRGNRVKDAVKIFEQEKDLKGLYAVSEKANTKKSVSGDKRIDSESVLTQIENNTEKDHVGTYPSSAEPHTLFENWVCSKGSPEAKTKRAQHKSLLKTAKTIKTEEKKLVIVDFDDIDEVPSTACKESPSEKLNEEASSAENTANLAQVNSSLYNSILVHPPALPKRNSSVEPEKETVKVSAIEEEQVSVKANQSFLWRQNSRPPPPELAPSYRAVPAIVEDDLPEESEAEKIVEDEEELYDDILPSEEVENIYDDIGVVRKAKCALEQQHDEEEEESGQVYETCGGSNYDDCEGEGYQFVENRGPVSPELPKPTTIDHQETSDNLYDDVNSDRKLPIPEDSVSISYEAIYLARQDGQKTLLPAGLPGTGARILRNRIGVGRHGSSCSSTVSSGSSSVGNASSYCGNINSIYGEPLTDEQATAVAAAFGLSHADHSTGVRVPLSETSDEWVDLENTPTDQEDQDEEQTIVVYRDQQRRRRCTSWSRKARGHRTSKSPRRRAERVYITSSSSISLAGDLTPEAHNRFGSLSSYKCLTSDNTKSSLHCHSDSSHYKSVTLRSRQVIDEKQEVQEVSLFVEKEGVPSSDSESENHYETLNEVVNAEGPDPYDDFDSFDSDSDGNESFANVRHPSNNQNDRLNGKLPEPPAKDNIYGVLEAAGKTMQMLRKNLSLRTSDFSNKLKIRRKSNVDQRNKALNPSPPQTPPIGKSSSVGHITSNRYWSLRPKFRRSQSTTNATKSTFYLSSDLEGASDSSSRISQADSQPANSNTPPLASRKIAAGAPNGPLPPPPCSPSGSVSQGRRHSSVMARPLSPPPPPPPPVPKRNSPRKDTERSTINSSIYMECGVFNTYGQNSTDSQIKRSIQTNTTAKYAEAGLWDSSNTSCSSYSSHSEHGCDVVKSIIFNDEPLYQFYESPRPPNSIEDDSEGYEEIVDGAIKPHPTAMELIRPRDMPNRSLWCQIPIVINSQVLGTLTSDQKKLQEAKFELITSEASYLKSLNILKTHFMESPEFKDESVLSKNDHHTLFSNVKRVRECSERFLMDMEQCWERNIMLIGISEIVKRHAEEHFGVYAKYCADQISSDSTLKKLRNGDSKFSEALTRLESSPECQSLSLHSFLMLPMQRITRLPLLMDAVLSNLKDSDNEYETCQLALTTLNKVAADCNEEARTQAQRRELLTLVTQFKFENSVMFPIVSSSRWLVHSGGLKLWRYDDAKLTFGRKLNKTSVQLFLFNDVLIVAKRTRDGKLDVLDHCPRNLVHITNDAEARQQQLPIIKGFEGGQHLLILTMVHTDRRPFDMVLTCSSESDRERWLSALSPPQSEDPKEQLYANWNCPQVEAVHAYSAQQPDELSLNVGDVVNVLKKMKDEGWFEGERVSDGKKGWFPANHTVEVGASHIRSRNIINRHLILSRPVVHPQETRSKNK